MQHGIKMRKKLFLNKLSHFIRISHIYFFFWKYGYKDQGLSTGFFTQLYFIFVQVLTCGLVETGELVIPYLCYTWSKYNRRKKRREKGNFFLNLLHELFKYLNNYWLLVSRLRVVITCRETIFFALFIMWIFLTFLNWFF
jgi:hypothetical protein